VLGETYLPQAVLAVTADGAAHPALCYVAPRMVERPADPAYVDRILAAALGMGFPEEYVARISAFRTERNAS
jgi:hypothetical protein